MKQTLIMKFLEHLTQKINLNEMLTFLNMKFEGRQHSGLDDSKNIARIVIKMLGDRSELRVYSFLLFPSMLYFLTVDKLRLARPAIPFMYNFQKFSFTKSKHIFG